MNPPLLPHITYQSSFSCRSSAEVPFPVCRRSLPRVAERGGRLGCSSPPTLVQGPSLAGGPSDPGHRPAPYLTSPLRPALTDAPRPSRSGVTERLAKPQNTMLRVLVSVARFTYVADGDCSMLLKRVISFDVHLASRCFDLWLAVFPTYREICKVL